MIALSRVWAAGIESGGMGHEDDLLAIVGQIQNQLPGESRSLLIQIQVNAEQGKKPQATQMIRSVLGRTPPPGEQLCLSLANVSMKFGLGLEDECFVRSEQANGISPMLAYS